MQAPPSPPLRIAIIGGGIGGLCTALSLNYYCSKQVSIDVYEQAPQYKEIGAGVGIGVNAAKILHRIGVGAAIQEIAGRRSGVWITFRNFRDGSDVVTVPAPDADSETVKQLPVHRVELLDLLVGTVKGRAAAVMHAGKRCRKLTEQGDEVFVDFENGTTATADMVAGCDGIHSAVRAQFTTDKPEFSGRIAYRGLVPTSEIEDCWEFDTYSVTWLGKNRHFLCFPVSKSTKLNIVAFVAEEEENLGGLRESWTTVGRKEDIFEAFRDFEERVQKLIRLMPDNPSKWKLNDRYHWTSGCIWEARSFYWEMLPMLCFLIKGAGAGQAIEDGYILARALHDYFQSSADSLKNWAYVYQVVRLPRAQRVQRTPRDAVGIYQAQAEIMKDLTFEQCVPEIHKRVIDRMRWIWHDDLDEVYDQTVKDCKHAGVLR